MLRVCYGSRVSGVEGFRSSGFRVLWLWRLGLEGCRISGSVYLEVHILRCKGGALA